MDPQNRINIRQGRLTTAQHLSQLPLFQLDYFSRKGRTAKTQNENSKLILPEKELRGLSPNFHIHVSVSDLTINVPVVYMVRYKVVLRGDYP